MTGGSQPPKSTFEYEQSDSNIRLIQIRDYKTDAFLTYIPKKLARRFCSETDVMIGRYGPPLFQILRGLNGAYNVALMKAETDESLMSKEYLFYLLQDSELLHTLEGVSDRTCGQDGINMFVLNNYLLPIPPIKQQNKIIEYLNSIIPLVDNLSTARDDLNRLMEVTKSKVLDLAIRGKLVPQNPEDEPASVLLERIKSDKEELIKQGKLKRDKKESIIYKGDDNSYYQSGKSEPIKLPFEIPATWTWSNLQELCNYGECDNVPPEKIPSDAWILDLEDIEKDSGKILQRLTNSERQTNSTKHSFKKNMVLYSKLRPYLNKVVLADNDGYCTSEIIPLNFKDIIYPQYAQLFLMSKHFVNYANECSYGMKMPRLGTKDGQDALFALPPYSEQIRIADMADRLSNYLETIAESL